MVLRFHGIPGYYVTPYNLRPVMRVLRLWVSPTLDKVFQKPESLDLSSPHSPPVFGSILTAAGVRLAQTLQINQIHDETLCKSAEKTDPCRVHGVAAIHIGGGPDMLDREIRRRLWWFLLYRDW